MLEIWGLAVGLTGGAGYQHRIPIHGKFQDLRARTVNFSADNDLAADRSAYIPSQERKGLDSPSKLAPLASILAMNTPLPFLTILLMLVKLVLLFTLFSSLGALA